MSAASTLLAELDAAGVLLSLTGDDLRYQTRPGIGIAPYTDRIKEQKPALVALLALQDEIVAAASAAQHAFDRQHFDALWERWHTLHDEEMTNP